MRTISFQGFLVEPVGLVVRLQTLMSRVSIRQTKQNNVMFNRNYGHQWVWTESYHSTGSTEKPSELIILTFENRKAEFIYFYLFFETFSNWKFLLLEPHSMIRTRLVCYGQKSLETKWKSLNCFCCNFGLGELKKSVGDCFVRCFPVNTQAQVGLDKFVWIFGSEMSTNKDIYSRLSDWNKIWYKLTERSNELHWRPTSCW